jgi:mxaJ protein
MCSRFLSIGAVMLLLAVGTALAAQPLRICADPDDLPFSNRLGQGIDNQVAAMVAHDLGRKPVFVWARSRRGFVREQFNRGRCDVLMGVPQGMKGVATTEPYYRSSYVFVTRRREHLEITSFADPSLDGRRIGLQILEENLSPPSIPLIRAGHASQLVGFESFGAEADSVVRAVANGRVGVAVVWGPTAGYFAAMERLPVELRPVAPAVDRSGIPFQYSIAMGVHKNDAALRDALNRSINKLQPQIARVLRQAHVPTLPMPGRSL